MCFDNGWQFSFRVHNAEKHVTPSLKFDIQIEGMPWEKATKSSYLFNDIKISKNQKNVDVIDISKV